MKSHLIHLGRFGRYVLLACLVSTALALSVIRLWLLPRAADWREDLQTHIGAMIEETVQIHALSAGMRGFHPELMMRGFHIVNTADAGPSIEFDRLGVGVDMLGTLLSRKPVINRIELEGGKLRIIRKADGTLAVQGLKPSAPPAWLFADGEVIFTDIDLEWIEGQDSLALGRAHLYLRNHGVKHELNARLALPGKLGKSVRLSVELQGDLKHRETWNGGLYLEAKRLREGAFVQSLPVRMRSGEINFKAWGKFSQGDLAGAVARLEMERPMFVWRGENDAERMLGLDKLGTWLRLAKNGQGWRLDVERLALTHQGKAWPEADFALALDNAPDGALQSLRGAVSFLWLDDAQNLLAGLPFLDEKYKEWLHTLNPRGELKDARWIYQADGRFGFCGDLAGFSINSWENLPGIRGFTGHLCGNDRAGLIDLNATKAELSLAGVFNNPITLDKLAGRLQWERFGGKEVGADIASALAESSWSIVGNGIELEAPGLSASGGFALSLPAGEGRSPHLEANASLHDVEAKRLRDYLPLPVMGAQAASWLESAFPAGRISQSEVLFRGDLKDFPFAKGEGLFEAKIAAENMELDFNPDWPHLYDVKANILFFGPTMFVDSEGGRIGDIPLQPVHAETVDFIGDAWLGISSELDSDLSVALKFLQQTPIRHIPDRLADVADAKGDAHLDMQLEIPLASRLGDVAVAGHLLLKNDTLAIKGVNLSVEGLNGELGFSEKGLIGRQIAGKMLDEAIIVDVERQSGGGISLDVSGKAGLPALRKAFPGPYWQYGEGGFTYRMNLQIPVPMEAQGQPMRIGLSSDLAGLELKLPAPMAKAAAVKKDFKAEMAIPQNDRSSLRLNYGQEARMGLTFSAGPGFKPDGGDFIWNVPLANVSGAPGLGLFLKLDELDADAWSAFAGGFGDNQPVLTSRALDLQLGRVLWKGEDRGSLRLTGIRANGELAGEIDCKYGKGNYGYASPEFSPAVLRLDMERLDMPKLADEKDGQSSTQDPTSVPQLQIKARHFLRMGADLGALELETDRWTQGMNIKRLILHAENHDLDIKGSWMRQEGREETKIDGKLKVRDLGKLLTLLGYAREIQATPGESNFTLAWPGSPQQFSAAGVSGEVRLKLGRGSVLQIEPGLGRALGMLNLHTLSRLLLLDFSDLFGKGLAYDSMEGIFQLGQGQATTKGFLIDAAAANILVIGRVGLVAHDLDQTISVMPHALASLPLAGANVGVAALGAIVDFANRLVGSEEANIDSTNYSVTGTWDNPQIKRVAGNMTLDMIDRAWSDIKNMSGLGNGGSQ